MENKPTAMPPAQTFLKNAWHIYKTRFSLYMPYYALIGIADAGGGMVRYLGKIEALTPILALVCVIALNVISFLGIISLTLALNEDETQHDTIYSRALNRVVPFYILNILLGLAIAGGFLLLIFPGILFAIWFYFAPYVFLLEKTGIGEAFSRSKAYVRGRGGDVFIKSFTFGMVVVGLAIVFLLIPGVIAGLFLAKAPEIYTSTFSGILSFLFVIVVSPLATIYNYLLYVHFKQTKMAPPPAAPAPAPAPAQVQ